MNPSSRISHTVMRRVRAIHTVRTLAVPAASFGALALALWGIGREVWVAKVVENMFSLANPSSMLAYLANAFLYTDVSVQVLSIIALGATVWLARGTARILTHIRPLRLA